MASIGTWFSESRLVKAPIYTAVGLATWPGFAYFNKMEVEGMEHLENLPKTNVLFVSNHQTYFADVIALIQLFCAHSWGIKNKLPLPFYLLWPYIRIKFIAAEETMKSSFISRLFSLAGSVSIKRTWRKKGEDVQRDRDETDTQKIDDALKNNWVITFPQGTTKPFAPGRKGTAHIIKNNQPIVIPVVINGFWRAFDKTGLKYKKKGVKLKVRFKAPLEINYNHSADAILEQLMEAIEQSKSYMLKGPHHFSK